MALKAWLLVVKAKMNADKSIFYWYSDLGLTGCGSILGGDFFVRSTYGAKTLQPCHAPVACH
jgi:hypothetical protein